ncbi:MAG: hypothetical protein EOO65_01000 [Methanosarcinales archaeon]|nr:MAG: hypothetical protein EOO65_01000 [Methanosarcinales archaeon]
MRPANTIKIQPPDLSKCTPADLASSVTRQPAAVSSLPRAAKLAHLAHLSSWIAKFCAHSARMARFWRTVGLLLLLLLVALVATQADNVRLRVATSSDASGKDEPLLTREQHQKQLDAMMDWLRAHGAALDNVELVSVSAELRQQDLRFKQRRVQPGDTIFSVPTSVCLQMDTLWRSPVIQQVVHSVYAAAQNNASDAFHDFIRRDEAREVGVALFAHYEMFYNQRSFFLPYLQTMRKRVDHIPIFFQRPDAELMQVMLPHMRGTFYTARREAEEWVTRLSDHVLSHFPQIYGSSMIQENRQRWWHELSWTYQLVKTRGSAVFGAILIPLFDLLPHSGEWPITSVVVTETGAKIISRDSFILTFPPDAKLPVASISTSSQNRQPRVAVDFAILFGFIGEQTMHCTNMEYRVATNQLTNEVDYSVRFAASASTVRLF